LWLIGVDGYGVCCCIKDLSRRMVPFQDAFATIKGIPLFFFNEVVISHVLVGRIADESAHLLFYILVGEFHLD
jgi:hypothetical protein